MNAQGLDRFHAFRRFECDASDSLIVITLPDPQITITASHIDFKGGATIRFDLALQLHRRRNHPAGATGEDSIRHHIERYGLVEASRTAAARVLVPMLKQLGYAESNIIVRFRKDFNNNDLIRRVRTLNTPAS